jgi:hypothetical protein
MGKSLLLLVSLVGLFSAGCGLKVVNPEDEKNKGALAVDYSDGIKLVPTYTCKLESMGNRFSALGKSEDEASKEVLARCKDRTTISFCKPEKIKCFKN